MPITIERDNNNVIVKKQIINVDPNIKEGITSIGVIGTNDIVLNSIKLRGTVVNSDAISKLEYSNDVTLGSAQALKAITVNSTKDIDGLNILSINGLVLNGTILDPSLFTENTNVNTGEDYITDITIGFAQANKALVTDYNYNINNLNFIELNNLQLNNKTVKLNYSTPNINNLDIHNNIINSNWLSTETSNTWLDITYSDILNLYVAVGDNIVSSNNGIKWEERYVGSFKSVTWGVDKFVAFGENGIIYSSDAITWNLIELDSLNLKSICYGNNKFIGVGENITIYSNNGVNWHIGTMNYNIKKIIWAHNIFIGIGDSNIYTSLNGIDWHLTFEYNNLNTICFSFDLNRIIISSNDCIIYSDDLINWNKTIDNTLLSTITWSTDLKIFIGLYSSNDQKLGYYSKDGLSWIEFNYGNILINSMIWSSIYKKIIGVGKGIINSCLSKKNISLNKIFINNNGNLGLNIVPTTHKLEVVDSNGKCLKIISDLDNYTKFDINNKKLTIDSTTYLNLSAGLMLNDELVIENTLNLNNYLTGITPGLVTPSSVISVNSSRNISGIKSINTLNLTVNGVSKNINSNVNTFKDVKVGISKENKALILDSNNNIENINIFKTNKLSINDTYIKYNSNTSFNNLNKQPNLYTINVDYLGTYNKLEWFNNTYILVNN